MAEIEKKPFWVTDDEKDGLKGTPQNDMAGALEEGVPELNKVEKGDVVGAWTEKDDLFIYHFYKRDRKEIYDQAHADMDEMRDQVVDQVQRDRLQSEIAVRANQTLAEHPWWPEIETILEEVFSDHFKYHPHKITYYSEVDSWSVMLPIPNTPVPMTDAQLEVPFSRVALRVGG